MENVTSSTSGPSIQLGDIYYLLFRHKWKILICTLLGLAGAAVAYKLKAPPFTSESKLLIRYVSETREPGPSDNANVKLPELRAESIIGSEVQILKSIDLAQDVARAVGPEKIVPKVTGPEALIAAALTIHGGGLDVQPMGNVLLITFTHPDPTVVQPVLREVVDLYLKKHVEVHNANGLMGELLSKETDNLRAQLAQTEEELRKARAKLGVISPEEAKKTYAEMLSRLKQEIFSAQAQLAEHTAILQEVKSYLPPEQSDDKSVQQISADTFQKHKDLNSRIEALRRREQELLIQFTPENARVKEIRTLLADATKAKANLEGEYPQLSRFAAPSNDSNRDQINKSHVQLADEIALIASLEARVKVLHQQYDQVRSEATALDQVEGSILELRRQQELQERNYLEYSNSLAKSRNREALSSDRVSNISQIQSPSPPTRNWKKTYQLVAAIAASGLVLGLGWAALIEFFFDRSVRRPNDVEQALRLPLFLAIPSLAAGGRRHGLPHREVKLLKNSDPSDTSESIVPHEEANILNPYFETLRDRLIAYFESINLRHRPKLIAVTGLGKESGVSTTAAGLARSLSETGEGNVLLVDMTQRNGEGTAMPFSQGKAIADIDHILANQSSTKGENKLFVVSEGTSSEKLSRQLPQRFSQLVPKLKASNFDYIIFDMPPVSQISVTARLASSMDMVLMVVESEKTDREMAQRAASLLSKANANVGVVLNKTKTYVPGKLFKDREFFLDS